MKHKDLKIGLALGLLLIIIAVLWLVTDPRLSTETRMTNLHDTLMIEEGQSATNNLKQNESVTEESAQMDSSDSEIIPMVSEPDNLPAAGFSQNEEVIEYPEESEPEIEEIETVETITQESIVETQEQKQLIVSEVLEEQEENLDWQNYIQEEKIKTQKFHIVSEGENLSVISLKYYGTANQWRKIFNANRDVISDANKVKSGIKLIIPD